MTSDRTDQECFVYITLPGTTEAVTAGRFQLRIDSPLRSVRPQRRPPHRAPPGRRLLRRVDEVLPGTTTA